MASDVEDLAVTGPVIFFEELLDDIVLDATKHFPDETVSDTSMLDRDKSS